MNPNYREAECCNNCKHGLLTRYDGIMWGLYCAEHEKRCSKTKVCDCFINKNQ